MINTVVEYLQLKLAGIPYMDKVYGLAELINKGNKKAPFIYCNKGEYKEIKIDSHKAATYFRKNGNVSLSVETLELGNVCSTLYRVNIPLLLNVFVNKKNLPSDDEYTDDKVAQDLIKVLTTKSGDLRKSLKAKSVNIVVNSYSNNNEEILKREYFNYNLSEINFNWVVLSLNITTSILIDVAYFNEMCNIDTDILHSFNFCNEATFNRLTQAQKDCLSSKLCSTGGGEVEIYNSQNTLIATVTAPSTYILADENYEIYVDYTLVDSGLIPIYGNYTININL